MTDFQSFSGTAKHPAEMSSPELALALDNYVRWTVLEPSTQDLLNSAAQRLRAVAQGSPDRGEAVTEEMVNAALDAHAAGPYESPFGPDGSFAAIYRAMRAAAPQSSGIAYSAASCGGWQDIATAPRDGTLIEIKGIDGPYAVTTWEGLSRWSTPKNWHKDQSNWTSPDGAVLALAGYKPSHWRPSQYGGMGEAVAPPMREALENCLGCVSAAESEGLHEIISELRGFSEQTDRLIDLIERRLLWVREYAVPALAAPQPPAIAPASPGTEPWTAASFWVYAAGLTGELEASQMRDTLAERGLRIVGIDGDAYAGQVREALELAEDVLSRSPFSTDIWPNGVHPNTGITKIRAALSSMSSTGGGPAA